MFSIAQITNKLGAAKYVAGSFRGNYGLSALFIFLGSCAMETEVGGRGILERSVIANTPAEAGAGNFQQPVTQFSREGVGETRPKPIGSQPGKRNLNSKEQIKVEIEINLKNFKNRLVSIDGNSVIKLMGLPEFERAEPPAKIWQYRTSACVVDVFLYYNDGGFVVEHVDLRGREHGRAEVDERLCFASIIQNRT